MNTLPRRPLRAPVRTPAAGPRTTRMLVTCMLAALLAAGCSGQDEPPAKPAETARAVSVAPVAPRAMSRTASASGLLVPREEAAVGVEQTGFRVVRVFVEEGARVRAGQALATLDDAVFRERLAQTRAQAENAQSEADRVRGLDGTGVMSDEDIANRRSQARVAQAQLREVQAQAARMTVRAPVSGIVLERGVRPGSISGGEPMFRIARDGLVELDAEVPEAATLSVAVGQRVAVAVADGQTFAGTVRLVSPRIDPQTKLGRVRVALPPAEALRVGGFARATFVRMAAPVPAVPERAVQFEASGPVVTVIGEDNRAKRMQVKTGARSGGFVELLQGPPLGSRVALGGGAFLLDGDLVKPMATAAAATTSATTPATRPAPAAAPATAPGR